MSLLQIERIGGIAGFGLMGSRIRSEGQFDLTSASDEEVQIIDSLFSSHSHKQATKHPDGFQFRISRQTPSGIQTVLIPESEIPHFVSKCVSDKIV